MEFVLGGLTILYSLAVLVVLLVLLIKPKIHPLKDLPFISVIIAARNEESRIGPTLESLAQLKYPGEKYEVIFVDDASTDKTAERIEAFTNKYSNWLLIKIGQKDTELKGKKLALKQAIEKARGEIILTTDADCIVPQNWLKAMATCFEKNTSMVLGHALLLKQKGLTDKLLRFDNLFSAIMMAAPARLGFAISSVGRNMAYRKKSYLKSGGYEQLSIHKSGDDVHLTELFRKKVHGKITFNFSRDSFTSSRRPDSFKEILHQQIRKNSKLLKKSLPTVLLSVILFGYHVLLIVFPFIFPGQLPVWLILAGIKLVSEFTALVVAAGTFADPGIIPFVPFMQIFYPLYVSVLGITGIFQQYEWKQ